MSIHHTYRPAERDTIVCREFESVGDFVRYARDTPPADGVHVDSRDPCSERGFFGTAKFEDAVTLASAGWPEGAARVAALREGCEAFLAAAKAAKTRGYGWDVTGDFIDVGRLLSGEPECCGQEQDGLGLGSRVASIRLNACVSASVSTDAITARGLTVLVAADLLESCGIRCEVLVSLATYYEGRLVEANVTVKQPGDPVDIDRLAFSIAHPSFFRRLGIAFIEANGHSGNSCRVASMSDYEKREGTVEIDGVCTGDGLSDDELRANVLAIARGCGLEFSDEELAEITRS